MAEVFNNLAKSTLAFAITNVATELTVATTDGALLFPVLTGSDFFRAVLFNRTTANIEIRKLRSYGANNVHHVLENLFKVPGDKLF